MKEVIGAWEKGEREVSGFLKQGEVYPAVCLMLKKIKRPKEEDNCEFSGFD